MGRGSTNCVGPDVAGNGSVDAGFDDEAIPSAKDDEVAPCADDVLGRDFESVACASDGLGGDKGSGTCVGLVKMLGAIAVGGVI